MSSHERFTLNVRGQLFTTTTDTLSSLPNTRLGKLASHIGAIPDYQKEAELFFDRNPEVINSILDLYRTGELHLPKHLCFQTVKRELKFWGIPTDMIQECCYKDVETHENETTITEEIEKIMIDPYKMMDNKATVLSKWNKIWLVMENPTLCTMSKVWSTFYFTMTLFSVLISCLESSMSFRNFLPRFVRYIHSRNITVEDVRTQVNLMDQLNFSKPVRWLALSRETILVFFILEWFVRFTACPDKRRFMRQARNLLDLFCNVQAVAHLIVVEVVLPATVNPEEGSSSATRAVFAFFCLALLRLLRVFYLAKDFDSMKMLILSARASVKVLALLTLCLLSLATIFGAAAFLVELSERTCTFCSIPYGMWYAIITMTTVGYGDVYPTSTAGRVVGILCALCGVVVMALPISVLATTFSNYHGMIGHLHQRQRRAAFLEHNPDFRGRAAASADGGVASSSSTAKTGVKVAWAKGSSPESSKTRGVAGSDNEADGGMAGEPAPNDLHDKVKKPGLCFPIGLPQTKKILILSQSKTDRSNCGKGEEKDVQG